MSSPLYQRMAKTASTLLSRYGRPVRLYHFVREHDPVKGKPEVTAYVQAMDAANAKPSIMGITQKLTQELTEGKLLKLIMTPLASITEPMEPIVGDVVVDGETYYLVRGLDPVKPADTTVMYGVYLVKTNLTQDDQVAMAFALNWTANSQ